MPLVQCPECGGSVSSAAAACPKCGHPMRAVNYATPPRQQKPVVVKPDFWRDPNVGAVALFLLVAFFVLLWWLFASPR